MLSYHYLLVLTAVGALTIPVSGTVALDDVVRGTSNGNISSGNNNRIEVRVESITEGLHTTKKDVSDHYRVFGLVYHLRWYQQR